MSSANSQYSKADRFSDKPFVKYVLIPIVSAALSGIAVYFITATNTKEAVQSAVLNQIKTELNMEAEKRSLSEAILEIKDERDSLTNELEIKKAELEAANEQITHLLNSSESDISDLSKQLEETNKQLEEANAELSAYEYYSPKVTVDGIPVTTSKDSLLSHKGRIYYDESIINHFFSDEQLTWNNGKLDFITENSIVTINPQLKNAFDLTSMEETSSSGKIGFTPKADNNNTMHHDVVYAYDDGTRYIEYRLDREYRWFDCQAFVTKTAANHSYDDGLWSKASISITADNGITLWGSNSISRDSDIQYSGLIDISGVKYIRITFYNTSEDDYYGGNPYLVISKPRLYLE